MRVCVCVNTVDNRDAIVTLQGHETHHFRSAKTQFFQVIRVCQHMHYTREYTGYRTFVQTKDIAICA